MAGMYHDVRTIKRRAFGIVIEEGTASSQHIPRIVDVEILHAEPKREVHARYRFGVNLVGNELTLPEHPAMVFEFLSGVRRLRWIDQPANLDDRLEIRGFQEADTIVGWKHKNYLSRPRLGRSR
jgi:hypothetical protein